MFKRAILFLLLASVCFGAWSDRFVTADASGGNGDVGTPWTIQEAMTTAVAEDWVWVEVGSYDVSGGTLTPAGQGDVSLNKRLVFKGYNTVYGDASAGNFISDMDIGQAFYQGPEDALKNGIDTTKTIDIDGGGTLAAAILTIPQERQGIEFYNLYFHNNDLSAPAILITSDITPNDIFSLTFGNCKTAQASGGLTTVVGDGYNIVIDSCYFLDTNINNVFKNVTIKNSIINKVTAGGIVVENTGDGLILQNTTIIGGNTAIRTKNLITVDHCTLYNQATQCLFFNDGGVTGSFVSHITNSIIMPTNSSAKVFRVDGAAVSGTVIEDYNCLINVDGTAVSLYVVSGGAVAGLIGSNDLQTDPLFISAPTDFRLKPESPLLNAGDGTIGGWQPYAIPKPARIRARYSSQTIYD